MIVGYLSFIGRSRAEEDASDGKNSDIDCIAAPMITKVLLGHDEN